MTDTSGFDFLSLTKAQWAHLYRIEREHGIPWNIYLRDLVRKDMEGGGYVPKKKKKKKTPSYDVDALAKQLNRIEDMLTNPQRYFAKVQMESITAQVPIITKIIEDEEDAESAVKPSIIAEKEVDLSKLSDGTSIGSIREELMAEIHEKFGIKPDEKKKYAPIPIDFPDHVQIIPPKPTEKVEPPPPPPKPKKKRRRRWSLKKEK